MLKISNLHAFYGKSHILHGVDMMVGKGEIVTLLGRNGTGRSTLCKAIMGLVRMEGIIRFHKQDIAGLPPYKIARLGLGYVPEHRDIFPDLTVRQNLSLGRKPGQKSSKWNTEEFFDMFPNLAVRRDTIAGVLSGGEKQMLTMCRALMGDPALLIIDEPTEGLAPKIVEQIGDMIATIARSGLAVLLVEQKLTIATKLAHRTLILGHGRIVFDGTPEEMKMHQDVQREWLEV